jgi:hypothetical protein
MDGKKLDFEGIDVEAFRHYCVTHRHDVIVDRIEFDEWNIPTAHIRPKPSDEKISRFD